MASAFDTYFYEINGSALVYMYFKAKVFNLILLLQRMPEPVRGQRKYEKIRMGKRVREIMYVCGSIGRENGVESEVQNNFEFVENHVKIQNHAPSFERCLLGRYSQQP
jgi:hypothetical protein